MTAARYLRWLWVAVAIQIAGRLLDLRWHLANDEFEGTPQQFEAHWLLWVGVLATLSLAAWGWRSGPDGVSRSGLGALVVAALAYVAVATWHFVEHANGADPELAHVLLGVTQLAMVLIVLGITLRTRRGPAPLTA